MTTAEQNNPRHFLHWRNFLKLEASGIRTASATVLPLIVGQITGFPAIGLFVGLSGLYLSVTDKEGSTVGSLFLAMFLNALSMFAGTIIGNDIWLSIFLMFVGAFVGGMAGTFGEVASQIGFVATLVFAVALGQPANFEIGTERVFEFITGGMWSVILTLTLWHFHQKTSSALGDDTEQPNLSAEEKKSPFERLFNNLTFGSIIFRHALRLGIAATIAIAVFKLFRLEHGYWLIITALVIVKPVFADTRRRAFERVLGSIAGGIIAILIAASVQNIVALDVLLLVFSILAFSHVRHNYGIFVFFITPFVILMIDTVVPGDWEIALTRILDTCIGGAIALTVTFLLRPKSAFKL